MKISTLISLIESGDYEQLRDSNKLQFSAFRLAKAKKETPLTIRTCDQPPGAVFSSEHLKSLLDAYLRDRLDDCELEYIASALEMAEYCEFESDTVGRTIFELSSPEISRPISHQVAQDLLRSLRS